MHVEDLLLRRSTLAWLGEVSLPLVQEMAGIMAAKLGWTENQKQAEMKRTVDQLKDRHDVSLS